MRGERLTRAALLTSAACALCGCGLAGRVAGALRRESCTPALFDKQLFDDAMSVRVLRGEERGIVSPPYEWRVAIPPGHVESVAYVLGGRGSTAFETLQHTGVRESLGAWVRNGGRPFALATLDSGESYFHARRNGEDRLWNVTHALPQRVARALGRAAVREALIGFSMGGYGALLAAEREPRRYAAVAVAGPAIFPSYADEARSVGDAFDDAADFARNDVIAHAAALRNVPVLVRCGDRDPFVPGVRTFERAASRGTRVDVVPGSHDDCFWRASAPALIAHVGNHL